MPWFGSYNGGIKGHVTVNYLARTIIRSKTPDRFYIHRPNGLVDVHFNVPEIARGYDINIEIPAAWRLITIRESILFISERELPRQADGSFQFTNAQRAKGLLSAACGVLQDKSCEDTKRSSFCCRSVFGCYLLEGLNGCSSCYWNKRNSYCSYRDPDNSEGAPRTPTTQRSRRNGSSLNLSPTETALLRRVLFEQQRMDDGGGE